jgi:cell division protein ZapE
LFERSVVVVSTSNTGPDDLYKGQPGRDAFLPFTELIKSRLDVLVMDGGRDFRRARRRGLPSWYVPADESAERALDQAFVDLAGGATPRPERLSVLGRRLLVPLAADRVARFDFATLCGTALGPADYLALATHFAALVLDRIPRLSPDKYDAARRFVILIDTLYDHRVKLVASAEAAPDELYEIGEGAKMFERTASRLEEMQSQKCSSPWFRRPVLPAPGRWASYEPASRVTERPAGAVPPFCGGPAPRARPEGSSQGSSHGSQQDRPGWRRQYRRHARSPHRTEGTR